PSDDNGNTPIPDVNTKGDGTLNNPYTPADAATVAANLTWTSKDNYQKTDNVFVKGKISRIADKGTFGQSGTFGNASFYISEDGSQTNEFYCFRILYLGNQKYTSGTDIKVGDEVIICGKLMNYSGTTPETVAGEAYLYSLNNVTTPDNETVDPDDDPTVPPTGTQGDGTLNNPYSVSEAISAVSRLTWTSNTEYEKTGVVYVKGRISRIANKGTYGESGTFGNATFWISDDGSQSNEFQCYRILYLDNQKYTSGTDISVGDDVIICGKLMNYKGNTPETVANEAYLYALSSIPGTVIP
ncbi:MAG: OB-fold nucleic acid binding domain-containing protein, partial [Prevotella sp.]|nr:OB-fold nucleic acid binding domain-containing protein [Prevotella sp.]